MKEEKGNEDDRKENGEIEQGKKSIAGKIIVRWND